MIAQQTTVKTIADSAKQGEQVASSGLTGVQIFSLGFGIVVGCALLYIGYKFYKKRRLETLNIFDSKKNLRSFSELESKKEHIVLLDSSNLRKWFHDNRVEEKEAKLMIAIPSEKVINALGYKLDAPQIDLEKCIIQSIYNSKTGSIYKLRFIAYESIESVLQVKLLENNGLVILDDKIEGGNHKE